MDLGGWGVLIAEHMEVPGMWYFRENMEALQPFPHPLPCASLPSTCALETCITWKISSFLISVNRSSKRIIPKQVTRNFGV